MQKSALLAALKSEFQRHDFRHFVDEALSIAQGGKGVVSRSAQPARRSLLVPGRLLDLL
jgi:hypothetical protein